MRGTTHTSLRPLPALASSRLRPSAVLIPPPRMPQADPRTRGGGREREKGGGAEIEREREKDRGKGRGQAIGLKQTVALRAIQAGVVWGSISLGRRVSFPVLMPQTRFLNLDLSALISQP